MTSDTERNVVAVGIPTYNRLDKLRVAVASAVGQTYSPVSVIVADNASTDGTEEFCLAESQAGRIRYLRHPRNIGATANFRSALDAATGEYFIWLGDDDRLDPDYVAGCVGALRADPGLVLAAGLARYHDDEGERYRGRTVEVRGSSPVVRIVRYLLQVQDNGTFYGVTRLPVLRRAAPLSNEMGGDWLLIAELAVLGEITTLDTTSVHRALGGTTKDLRSAARSLGLGPVATSAPQVAVLGVFVDALLRGRGTFSSLSVLERVTAAVGVAVVMSVRFIVPKTAQVLVGWARRLAASLLPASTVAPERGTPA